MRKKVDSRIRVLVENCVKTHQRAMFVIVGDKGRDQVVNLHYMLNKITTKKPPVLWCYKKELGFSSHRKKRMKQLKKKITQGGYDPNVDDPFELFVSSTNIRYCFYKETHTILGKTFGMCVLQDFEALTPNLLCRTIETVEGGGIVVLLLKTMDSLKQLYSLTMDVHTKLRTETHPDVEPRFNERFLLSLAACQSCLVVDDELNILPLSQQASNIVPLSANGTGPVETEAHRELSSLKQSMKETQPIGSLLQCALTLDQAQAVMTFADVIAEKTLKTTVSLTAGRGRGKSAALGLAIASAIAFGYSNIFVTAPTPENVSTVFEFIQKGLNALGMAEHSDYELMMSDTAEFGKQLTRINVFRDHRQTVQYVAPSDHQYLAQAELVVIDEAAAIPLPLVKKLIGPYAVLMASTVNGYEGTGRALSLKLVSDLKKQPSLKGRDQNSPLLGRTLKEITLQEPIRYSSGDKIESWLADLLCLDATSPAPLKAQASLPPPSKCRLYMVNRDALFSYHKASERFFHKMMSLFVSSHYKNTPNDIILLSDAPAHHIFVLLPPLDEGQSQLPDILVAVQVCIEGNIAKESIKNALGRGLRPSGDLLPWTLSQHFIDENFGALSGVRIVRVATHPSLQRMGYGSEALRQLVSFFEEGGSGAGDMLIEPGTEAAEKEAEETVDESKDDEDDDENEEGDEDKPKKPSKLLAEELKARQAPPLLSHVSDIKPPYSPIDYIGTSFGLTLELFNFWSRLGFDPVYLRQQPSDITGEHSAIMLRPLKKSPEDSKPEWLGGFTSDFRTRLINLLPSSFNQIPTPLALSLVDPPVTKNQEHGDSKAASSVQPELPPINAATVGQFFTEHDLLRLRKYAQQVAEFTLISDLMATLCWLLFTGRFPGVTLSYLQCAILLALGCLKRTPDQLAAELRIPGSQVMALLNKAIHKLSSHLHKLEEEDVAKSMDVSRPRVSEKAVFVKNSLVEEQEETSKEVEGKLKEQRDLLMKTLKTGALDHYKVTGISDEELNKTLKGRQVGGTVSVRKRPAEDEEGASVDPADPRWKKQQQGQGQQNQKKHKHNHNGGQKQGGGGGGFHGGKGNKGGKHH